MAPWLRYALGILIAVHGFIYVPFAFYLTQEFQPAQGRPKLLGALLEPAGIKTATLATHAAAGLLLLACGVLLLAAPGALALWRTLAIAGGTVAILAFLLAWNGRPTHLSEQGILGAAASLAVVLAAVAVVPRIS